MGKVVTISVGTLNIGSLNNDIIVKCALEVYMSSDAPIISNIDHD